MDDQPLSILAQDQHPYGPIISLIKQLPKSIKSPHFRKLIMKHGRIWKTHLDIQWSCDEKRFAGFSSVFATTSTVAQRRRKILWSMICSVLCYAMLASMLCYAMLCYAMLCYAMLCYAMLCYAMLCYAMLCYTMLCDAMRCYAMLCDVMWYKEEEEEEGGGGEEQQ